MKRIIVAAVAGAMLAVPSVAIADTFTVCHEGGCTETTETVITVKDASGFTFTTSVESLHAETPVFDEGIVPASEPTVVHFDGGLGTTGTTGIAEALAMAIRSFA